MENSLFRTYQFGKKNPAIRRADIFAFSTTSIMVDFIISLIPLIIFNFIKSGLLPFLDYKITWMQMLKPLIFPVLGGLFSFLVEALWLSFRFKADWQAKLKTSYGMIPGILLGMILPSTTPLWVFFFGIIFGMVFGKLLFGGFGQNIVNPALLGYLFINLAFYGVITKSSASLQSVEAITGTTPLTYFKAMKDNPAFDPLSYGGGIHNLFFGFHPGSGAETPVFLIIISGLYLSARGIINWRTPVSILVTAFILTTLASLFLKSKFNFNTVLFQMFSGGLFFGSVFMATDPVTSPRTPEGKIVFGVLIGIITVILRLLSSMPEGMMVAILMMNLMVFLIDDNVARMRVAVKKWQRVNFYFYMAFVALFLIGFLFLKLGVSK